MKRCRWCGVEKDAACFYARKTGRDRLTSYCKACTKGYAMRRQKHHAEEVRAYQREYQRDYYWRNRERVLTRQRTYQAKRREEAMATRAP